MLNKMLASAQEFLPVWINGSGRPEGKKEVIIISQNYIRCLIRCLPCHSDALASAQEFLPVWPLPIDPPLNIYLITCT